MFDELSAISPLDGRYRRKIKGLAAYVSEAGLIRYRIKVEAKWLLRLAGLPEIRKSLNININRYERVAELADRPIPDAMVARVKEIESRTNHDVKAVEYVIREHITGTSEEVLSPLIHFACTSEDINNTAYNYMMIEAANDIVVPAMAKVVEDLKNLVQEYQSVPMLSRTHGQTASPTTLGKELAVFAHRLLKVTRKLKVHKLDAKFSGAVGNFNAHFVAYPEIDWPAVSKAFIEEDLGFAFNPLTTQIENHDSLVEYLDYVRSFNVILLGLCRDVWSYISLGYFKLKAKEGEVGSSTMPHKVNPIDFENAEGNLGLAMGLSQHLVEKLPISRWQRDLSDSTVLRSLGTVLGYSLLSYASFQQGLSKLSADKNRIERDLGDSWEVLTEALQVVLKRYGVSDGYERIKNASRGKTFDKKAYADILQACPEIPPSIRSKLEALTPQGYVGIAERLASEFVRGEFGARQ
ncbi:MAG: adenylosuccinate lyase [Oligoflexales bacterium]